MTRVIFVNVTIRNVEETTYRKLKGEAAREALTIGEYLAKIVEEIGNRKQAKNPAQLLEYKPVGRGKKFRNASRMIDKWLYEEGA